MFRSLGAEEINGKHLLVPRSTHFLKSDSVQRTENRAATSYQFQFFVGDKASTLCALLAGSK